VRAISKELYPFEGRYLDRRALRLHYLDEGPKDAEPVVMVHGNPTWSFFYRDVVRALSITHRCIVPDHIGCGLSDKPGDDRYDYTLRSRVEDLTALIEKTIDPKKKIHLVVHDWGGMIGFAWAAKHPERLASLTVMNTAAFRLPESKRFPAPLALVRSPIGALMVRGGNAFSRTASHVCTTKTRLSSEVRHAYTAPYDSWADRIATLRFVEDIPLAPTDRAWSIVAETESLLPGLADVPMLIGWGLKDFVFDKHFLAEWERHFPKADVRRFPESGHYVLEDERDTLIPAIAKFIRSHAASPNTGT
jgi:pimeloyl-ACP methyl ester carboxylesterase